MTYPTGGHGYPPSQQPGQYSPAPAFATADEVPSKLPVYLLAAVVVFGIAGYLFSFGPMWATNEIGPIGGTDISGGSFEIVGLVLAAMLAAVSLVPRQRSYTAVIAVIAIVGFLMAISEIINKPQFLTVGWALMVIVILGGLQSIAGVGALLVEAGVVTPPQPQPRYDQYSQYGYYGQPAQPAGGGQTPPAAQSQQNAGQQRSGYPSYGGYPQGPTALGFPASDQHSAPPTPPTGFPAYGQSSGQGGTSGQQGSSQDKPTQQVSTTQSTQPAPSQQPTTQQQSSSPSGPPPS